MLEDDEGGGVRPGEFVRRTSSGGVCPLVCSSAICYYMLRVDAGA